MEKIEDKIIRLRKKKLSCTVIGKEVGCSHQYVIDVLKKAGEYKRLGRSQYSSYEHKIKNFGQGEIEKMVEKKREGWTFQEIADKWGLNVGHTFRLIRGKTKEKFPYIKKKTEERE